jgi:non-ribosomal peptide synthetase component F
MVVRGEKARQVREASKREGVTVYMYLLAVYKVLLMRYSREKDIVVGTPIAGRTRSEIEGLIGFFVNTLVIRTDMGGEPTFGEMVGRVKEVMLEAYEHQEVPFEKLVEELQPHRSLTHSPKSCSLWRIPQGILLAWAKRS